MAIYGDAGIGKSSIGFTAKNPITLDFDNGAYRSAFRKDIVRVENWADIATVGVEDLAGYDTVVVDTVGRALDLLTTSLIAKNAKLATSQGNLTMSGYGALKASFISWLSRIRSMGKDVVLLAHGREDKKQDDTLYYRPDIVGGSASEIYKVADLIAYYHAKDGRTLEFSPAEAWVGKDPAGFGQVKVPDFTTRPVFLGDLIDTTKNALGAMSEEAREIASEIADAAAKIGDAGNPDDLNKIMAEFHEAKPTVKKQIWGIIRSKAGVLNAEFDKNAGIFVLKPDSPEEVA